MVFFHSYVSLPEGKWKFIPLNMVQIGLINPRINQARHPGRENLFMNGDPIFKDNIRAFCKVDVHPKPTNDTNVSLLKEQSRLEDFSGSPWQETPIEKIILGGFFGQITAPRFLPADDLPPSFHFTQAFRGHHVTHHLPFFVDGPRGFSP